MCNKNREYQINGGKMPQKPKHKTENKAMNNTRENKLLCGKGMVMIQYRSEANSVYIRKNIMEQVLI